MQQRTITDSMDTIKSYIVPKIETENFHVHIYYAVVKGMQWQAMWSIFFKKSVKEFVLKSLIIYVVYVMMLMINYLNI